MDGFTTSNNGAGAEHEKHPDGSPNVVVSLSDHKHMVRCKLIPWQKNKQDKATKNTTT